MNRPDLMIRREALWTLHWMTRGWGALLIALFTLLAALEIGATIFSGRLDGLRYSLAIDVAIALELSALTFAVTTWIYLFWRRTLAFFRPGRIGDLLVTPLGPFDLWPAMLAGPVVLSVAFAIIWEALVMLIPPLAGEKHYLLHLYLRPAASMSAEALSWIRLITMVRAPLMVIEAGMLTLACGSIAAYFVLPRGGAARLVLVLGFCQLLLLPEVLFSFWVDDGAVLTGTVGERHQLLCDHVLGPMMTVLLCWGAYAVFLRLLRGKAFWERLLAEVASR